LRDILSDSSYLPVITQFSVSRSLFYSAADKKGVVLIVDIMVCGPIYSVCVTITCLWGSIFLAILGVLFYTQSVGLFEDLPWPEIDRSNKTLEDGYWKNVEIPKIEDMYHQNAMNSWIGAVAHLVTSVLAFIRFLTVKNRV